MPPIKVCPHCHEEYSPKRDVISKFPVVVRWRYPRQCPKCGANLVRDTFDRLVAQDRDKLEVDG